MKSQLKGFVKLECARWMIARGGKGYCIDNPNGTCNVMEAKPCNYFRECVYPLLESRHIDERRATFQDTKWQYSKIDPKVGKDTPKERKCKCGALLEPRNRYCTKCRIAKRRNSNREASRLKRKRSNVSS